MTDPELLERARTVARLRVERNALDFMTTDPHEYFRKECQISDDQWMNGLGQSFIRETARLFHESSRCDVQAEMALSWAQAEIDKWLCEEVGNEGGYQFAITAAEHALKKLRKNAERAESKLRSWSK